MAKSNALSLILVQLNGAGQFAMGLLYDYHVLLTLGFVKVTRGYVKKAELKALPLFIEIQYYQLLLITHLNRQQNHKAQLVQSVEHEALKYLQD
jgi:hypothetical protein